MTVSHLGRSSGRTPAGSVGTAATSAPRQRTGTSPPTRRLPNSSAWPCAMWSASGRRLLPSGARPAASSPSSSGTASRCCRDDPPEPANRTRGSVPRPGGRHPRSTSLSALSARDVVPACSSAAPRPRRTCVCLLPRGLVPGAGPPQLADWPPPQRPCQGIRPACVASAQFGSSRIQRPHPPQSAYSPWPTSQPAVAPPDSLPVGAVPCLPAALPRPLGALAGGRTSSLALTVDWSCAGPAIGKISEMPARRVACRVREPSEALGGPVLSEFGPRCRAEVPPRDWRLEQESGMPGRDSAK